MNIQSELEVPMEMPLTIYADNTATITSAENSLSRRKAKRIAIQYPLFKEVVLRNYLKITSTNSANNLAELFTEALDRIGFAKFCGLLGIKTILVNSQGECLTTVLI